jgi:hypothetical protein
VVGVIGPSFIACTGPIMERAIESIEMSSDVRLPKEELAQLIDGLIGTPRSYK